jgi:pyruvate formate lyase activating enzyme
MLDIAKLAKQNDIKTVMVSNGFINEIPLLNLIPYIDASNIDLKFFNDKLYKEITGGSIMPVLNTIQTMYKYGVHIEVTNLIIEGINDNDEELLKMYRWFVDNDMVDIPIHILRFFPTYRMSEMSHTSIETAYRVRDIAIKEGLRTVYI